VARSRATDRRSKLGRVLRTIFWALVFAFLFGFVVGSLLRRELDRPVRYIGERSDAGSVLAANPCDVRDTLTRVLMPGHHEEQIG
jgi:hypothetical protein